MKTTILNSSNSPLLGGINSYIDKVKKEQAKKVIEKTYSRKNTYALLDFLIHASVAQDNIFNLLKMDIAKNNDVRVQLLNFKNHFSTLNTDFEIMQQQDDLELAVIMDNTDELATNIAFFNIANNHEFINAVNSYNIDKVAIGKVVDEINTEKEYSYFQFALLDTHREVKNICELIVHLIFVIHWSDKFVNVSGYNPTKIKEYCKNLISLLEPFATVGLKEHFCIEHSSSIVDYYKATCKAFFNINTSSKIEFMRLFKAYNSDSKKLLNTISNIKYTKKMEQIAKLAELTSQAQVEAEAFYNKGNKSAGTRLRKVMMDIKNLTSEVRKNVTETKNN